MEKMGFLLILAEPPAMFEEEFNAWYDNEHLPERLRVPGFETGLRFVSQTGQPRYLAIYDLKNRSVLESDAYKRVSGENFSPWTKRINQRVRIYRAFGDQIYPGRIHTTKCAFLHLARFHGLNDRSKSAAVAAMRAAFEGRPATLGVRVLECAQDHGSSYMCVVSAAASLESCANPGFSSLAAHVDLLNSYRPYS